MSCYKSSAPDPGVRQLSPGEVIALTTTELLAAFSGVQSRDLDALVSYSAQSRIIAAEIHAVGNNNTTAQFSGQEVPKKSVSNVLRIVTADGFESVSGVDSYHEGDFGVEHFLALQGAVAELATFRSIDPVAVTEQLSHCQPDLGDPVRASIDIALWDLLARKLRCPLYKLFGAKRDSVACYASLPFYATLAEYVDAVRFYGEFGFRCFKLHVWGSLSEDKRLIEHLEKSFAGSTFRFMIDLEEKYDFEEALELGESMHPDMFAWLEGPLPDEHLGQYRGLRERLAVPIVSDGCRLYSRAFVAQGIAEKAWDAGRFDATTVWRTFNGPRVAS